MNTTKTVVNHEKMKLRKLVATRNIIKNKFKKARKQRLEHENDAAQAIAPLSTIMKPAVVVGGGSSSFALSVKNQCEPNALCNKLRQLINSQIAGDVNCTPEILHIIADLRKNEILL